MREITTHVVEGDSANHQLIIKVVDEPSQGGANHEYRILKSGVDLDVLLCTISFQNGPIKDFGVNGVTQEALLAIVMDRIQSFQAGPFACAANAYALDECGKALWYLQGRTRERIARGVEGTHQK